MTQEEKLKFLQEEASKLGVKVVIIEEADDPVEPSPDVILTHFQTCLMHPRINMLDPIYNYPSGKEKRRARRAKQRKKRK